MKECTRSAAIFVIFVLILPGCNKDDRIIAPVDTPTGGGSTTTSSTVYTAHVLFTEPWGAADAMSELTALAYDPATDLLFWVKGRHQLNNELMRYNFSNGQIEDVYSFESQYDYGLRVFGTDLWIVRTYDTSLVKLSSLASTSLVVQAQYTPMGPQPSFHDVNDIAMVNGDMYYVTGNFLVIPKYEGLQCLRGPNYSSIDRVTPVLWSPSNYANDRSIVAVGTGPNAKLVIATGAYATKNLTTPTSLELRDLSGNLIRSQEGYGYTYLHTDSKNRIYATQTYHSPMRILRWSENLETKEVFSVKTSLALENCPRHLFVVRERRPDSVDVIMTEYCASRSPVFEIVTLPK